MHLTSCNQEASLVSLISHEGTARARSPAILITTRSNEQRGAWMYSRCQRSLPKQHFHPLSSLVQTVGHFSSAALPNTST